MQFVEWREQRNALIKSRKGTAKFEGKDGHPDLKGFGDGKRHFFWLKEGKPDPQAVHVGFVAKDHAEVDAFYKAAVDAGGKSKEAHQARPEYYPGYYATWGARS